MKVKQVYLECMAARKDQYPKEPLPEIVLAGRSNVGKSTFINSFCQRKKLAYTSSVPGKTQTINFYRVNEKFRLVDLPGYGFAQASRKLIDQWTQNIQDYLSSREEIAEVILLVDSRHDPSKEDRTCFDFLVEAGFSGIVVATKLDKVPPSKRQGKLDKIKHELRMEEDLVFGYSSLLPETFIEVDDLIQQIIEDFSQ